MYNILDNLPVLSKVSVWYKAYCIHENEALLSLFCRFIKFPTCDLSQKKTKMMEIKKEPEPQIAS